MELGRAPEGLRGRGRLEKGCESGNSMAAYPTRPSSLRAGSGNGASCHRATPRLYLLNSDGRGGIDPIGLPERQWTSNQRASPSRIARDRRRGGSCDFLERPPGAVCLLSERAGGRSRERLSGGLRFRAGRRPADQSTRPIVQQPGSPRALTSPGLPASLRLTADLTSFGSKCNCWNVYCLINLKSS